MTIRAILFDFDGLIIDTESPELQNWREVYEHHACDFPLVSWLDSIGRGSTDSTFDPYLDLERQLGRSVDRAAIRTANRVRRLALIEQQTALPGVPELLREASERGFKIGVASSSRYDWVSGHLRRVGLHEYIESFQCFDDGRKAKPHPELYLRLLEALDVAPDEAIALEDSPNGVRAARAAGIFCIAVPNAVTRMLDLAHASARLESLAGQTLDSLIELAGSRISPS